jgi:hypothetical protein
MMTHGIQMTQRQTDYPTVRHNVDMFHVQGEQTTTIMFQKLDPLPKFPPHQIGEYLFFFSELEEDNKCSLNSSLMSPIFTCLNEPKEGRVRSHMGPSMYDFMSPEKVNSMVFSYLESLKIFKEDSRWNFS